MIVEDAVSGIQGHILLRKGCSLTGIASRRCGSSGNLDTCLRSGMNDNNTLITALSKNDPCMTIIVSDIARLQLPSILWQIRLIYDWSPAFPLVIASNFTWNHCVSISYTGLCLHYLISRPAYKAWTVKSFRTIGSRKITVIIVIITGWIRWPFIIPAGHGIAETLSCGIIPSAAPYVKCFSNR